MEEKIIERADRKLYLDAVVIQQGRLAQQNTKLSKVCGVGCAHGMGAV